MPCLPLALVGLSWEWTMTWCISVSHNILWSDSINLEEGPPIWRQCFSKLHVRCNSEPKKGMPSPKLDSELHVRCTLEPKQRIWVPMAPQMRTQWGPINRCWGPKMIVEAPRNMFLVGLFLNLHLNVIIAPNNDPKTTIFEDAGHGWNIANNVSK